MHMKGLNSVAKQSMRLLFTTKIHRKNKFFSETKKCKNKPKLANFSGYFLKFNRKIRLFFWFKKGLNNFF